MFATEAQGSAHVSSMLKGSSVEHAGKVSMACEQGISWDVQVMTKISF